MINYVLHAPEIRLTLKFSIVHSLITHLNMYKWKTMDTSRSELEISRNYCAHDLWDLQGLVSPP
jgi:hypothetical protein